jgi:hypothetical protein
LIDDYGSRTTTPRIEVQLRLFRVRIHEWWCWFTS